MKPLDGRRSGLRSKQRGHCLRSNVGRRGFPSPQTFRRTHNLQPCMLRKLQAGFSSVGESVVGRIGIQGNQLPKLKTMKTKTTNPDVTWPAAPAKNGEKNGGNGFLSRGERWRQRQESFQREVCVVWMILKDSRTPWYARAAAACTVGYLFSPVQLIPSFIPVIGILDDFVVLWAGVLWRTASRKSLSAPGNTTGQHQKAQHQKHMITPRIPKSVCTLFLCICAATTTVAQQVSTPEPQLGTIVGTVLDPSGAVVSRARVVLRGANGEDVRPMVTQESGFFKFDSVNAGIPYHVSVSAKGFADWTSNEIILAPGQYLILTGINLQVAAAQVTVNVVPPEELAVQQLKAAEKQRIVGVLPNFFVVYQPNPAPLTPKLKFHLALKFLVDPAVIAGFGINAGIYQMAGYPSYGQGAKGFGQRLGATFAGGYTKILIGDAALPSLLHQDTRYFYQGTGTTKSRLLHALSSAFVIRGDDGRRQFNFSGIGGDLASGAIANAYYPDKDRGAGLVVRSALIGVGGRMANAVLQEFVFRKFTSQHTKPTP
jgi:uncharacterized membrane protein YkvA (DUF1232 family)